MLLGYVVLWIVGVLVAALVLEYLWNVTIPQLFGLGQITYWQSFRLLLIAGLLFGAFHVSLPVSPPQVVP